MKKVEAFISFATPQETFWKHYDTLWQNSNPKSVFYIPALVRFFMDKYSGNTATYQFWQDNELLGVGFFRKEKRAFHFLSDVRSDLNFFVMSSQLRPYDLELFFNDFFHQVKTKRWNLMLNKVPAWVRQYDMMKLAAQMQSSYMNSYHYALSPYISDDSPENLFDRMEISKNVQYKSRRLSRNYPTHFEILTGTEDMQNWVDDFIRMHMERWDQTDTPSKYHNKEERNLLLECLQIWAQEGVLVRAALVVEKQRIATNFGLLQGDTFVGQGQGYMMSFYKHSPGKVLFTYLIEWMKNNGIRCLDFGDGDDPYKYEFPVSDRKLERIQIANRLSIWFIISAFLQKELKRRPRLKNIFLHQLKPLLNRATHLIN
ncbi:MAG: GNAT family N-acetyltransferase [Lewinellaceae bacterium]|nr:GNAT family N-acetyltransferase [Lewinellaceae bacterium]